MAYVKQRAGFVVSGWSGEDGRNHNCPGLIQPCKDTAGMKTENKADLEALFGKIIQKHTDRLRVDSRIPPGMAEHFAQSMESYQRTAPALLAKSVREAERTYQIDPERALSGFYGDLLAQTDRLHTIQAVQGAMLQQYLAILSERDEEDYLFISERGESTCDHCERLHGQVFAKDDLAQGGVIPPLHPNCRCSLVALDRVGAWHYNSPNRAEMLSRLQLALDVMGDGGIYILDPRFVSFGIGPAALTRLVPSEEVPILGLDPKLQEVYRDLVLLMETMGETAQSSLNELGEDVSAAFVKILHSTFVVFDALFRRGETLFSNAAEMMEKNPLLGIIMFADATFFGLASAVLAEVRDRVSAFFEEPGILTGLNLLTLGLVDASIGVFNPEELWSPEHIADILGAAGLLSLFRPARSLLGSSFSSADEFARSALDEVARGATSVSGLTRSQMDDILRISKGKRPDPSTYLSSSYIDAHLSHFRNGVTKIASDPPLGTAGPPGGTYVMPTSLVDDLLKRADGDVAKLEEFLRLKPGELGNQPVRIDVKNPTGLRMPSGNERGTNVNWIPGGYTGGGIMEAIIDSPNPGQFVVNQIW